MHQLVGNFRASSKDMDIQGEPDGCRQLPSRLPLRMPLSVLVLAQASESRPTLSSLPSAGPCSAARRFGVSLHAELACRSANALLHSASCAASCTSPAPGCVVFMTIRACETTRALCRPRCRGLCAREVVRRAQTARTCMAGLWCRPAAMPWQQAGPANCEGASTRCQMLFSWQQPF